MKCFTEENKASIEKALEISKIIVATNLVVRAIDNEISDEL